MLDKLRARLIALWRLIWVHPPTGAAVGYLGIAVVFFAPLLTRLATHILADDSFIRPGQSDAFTGLWTYWWTQRALLMGSDLLHCSWVLPPTGADLTFHSTSIAPTALTLPLAKLFGVVTGYNLMVMLLIVGNAWMYFCFLSKTFDFSRVSAFWTGALFGFCPYFIFKAHAHVNLIGGLFWGGALAVLIHSYMKRKFSIAGSLLFALLLWSTFWTSLVEFFMLAIVLAGTILVFEIRALTEPVSAGSRRLLFFLPSLAGATPAAFLYHDSGVDLVSRPLFEKLGLSGLLGSPRLSVFSEFHLSPLPEYWGTYLPAAVIILAAIGVLAAAREKSRYVAIMAILAGLCLVLTLNPFGLPSLAIRALPMGSGFRVFARFFPFFLFFTLTFAAEGIERIVSARRSTTRAVALIALLSLAAVEYYPAKLSPSPVKEFRIPTEVKRLLNHDRFTLVIPDSDYRNIHDTYQVSLDMQCVNLSYLAREDSTLTRLRKTNFPIVYGGRQSFSPDQLRQELNKLNVAYLLFESKNRVNSYPLSGKVIAEDNGQILVDISGQF